MRYGREEPTTVYRVVYREPGGEWAQHATYTSRTARPYVTHASAKAIATDQAKYQAFKGFEWGVQKSELNWEDV